MNASLVRSLMSMFVIIRTSRCAPLQRREKRRLLVGTIASLAMAVLTGSLVITCLCRPLKWCLGRVHMMVALHLR